MLISFRVENHRSIRDEQAFSMEPGLSEGTDDRLRTDDGDRALSVAAVYGANASGKSNLLSAIAFMRNAVLNSHRFYSPEGGVPQAPFAWGPRSLEASFYEIVFKTGGVRYEYGFVASHEKFVEEWLYAYPTSRKQIWFERDDRDFKFGEHLKGENKVAEKVTRPNSLFLSAAAQNHHEQLEPVFRWFHSMRAHNVSFDGHDIGGGRARFRSSDHFANWWRHSASTQLSIFDKEADSDRTTRER